MVVPLLRPVLVEGLVRAGAPFRLLFGYPQQAPATDVADSKLLAGTVNLFVTEASVHANDNRTLVPKDLPDLFGQVPNRSDRGVLIVRVLRAAPQDRIRNKPVPRELKRMEAFFYWGNRSA